MLIIEYRHYKKIRRTKEMDAIVITRKVSYKAKMCMAGDATKKYYSEIKNALLSYKKVKSTISWAGERFNAGRTNLARIVVRGKTLTMYLNLDAADYPVNKFHQEDVSDKKAYAELGMKIKVKSDLGLKRALELVGDLAKENDLVINKKYVPANYAADFCAKTDAVLVKEGLIKML